MSREIKFRAWDIKRQKLIEDIQDQYDGAVEATGLDSGDSFGGFLTEAQRETPLCIVMQYTGLKDKHGVEIYEGDIVEQRNEIEMRLSGPYQVCWGQFGFTLYAKGGPESHYITPTQLVVMGNIYENGDLLK